MTPDWFRELAQRCADAAEYADGADEPGMARNLYLAHHIAEALAHRIDRDLSEDVLLPSETTFVIVRENTSESWDSAATAGERSTNDG